MSELDRSERSRERLKRECEWTDCRYNIRPRGCNRPEPFEPIECFTREEDREPDPVYDPSRAIKEHADFEAWVKKALDTMFAENRDYYKWRKHLGEWQNMVEEKIGKLQHDYVDDYREPNHEPIRVYAIVDRPHDKDHPEMIFGLGDAVSVRGGDENTRLQTVIDLSRLSKNTKELIIYHDELPEA